MKNPEEYSYDDCYKGCKLQTVVEADFLKKLCFIAKGEGLVIPRKSIESLLKEYKLWEKYEI
ncbi:MAG: hypothetical protein WCQ99_15940 [Pseudomonadota bacterium]